jgi:hypothetical protein
MTDHESYTPGPAWPASNTPTLNFGKNAKFRMGHTPGLEWARPSFRTAIEPEEASICGAAGYAERS